MSLHVAACALALGALLAGAAEAGERELEPAGFMKAQASYLRLPAAFTAFGLRQDVLVQTQTARAWLRFTPAERVSFTAAWQLEGLVASEPALAGAGSSGSLFAAGGEQARRRLADFDNAIDAAGGMRLQHNLDQLAVVWRAPRFDLTVGRQVLSWGSGRFWNPTDLLSPFAPTDIDREVRHGVDAVRAAVPLNDTAQLDLLWLPQEALGDHGAVARAQINAYGFDFSPSAAKYVRDTVVGFDVTGDLGPAGVRAEAAWTRALDTGLAGRRDSFVRAVAGADWRPFDDWVLTGEVHYNGWGAARSADYPRVLTSARVTRGEVYGAGRHYAGAAAIWLVSELLSVQMLTMVNLQDPSAMLIPVLEYWAAQEVLVRAGAYAPVGAAPDSAARGFTLRSEYGASPRGAFVQAGIYAQ